MILMLTWTINLYAMFYFADLALRKYRDQSKGTWKFYIWKFVVIVYGTIFIISDVAYDIVVGSIAFRQLPRWFTWDLDEAWRINKTFTSRLKHMKLNEVGWRYDLAFDFCQLINKIQPNHC